MARESKALWFSAAWSFLEATVFFIVPDVYLTRFALNHSASRCAQAVLAGLGGALSGGVILFWAVRAGNAPALATMFEMLPGVSPGLIQQTHTQLLAQGSLAFFSGALSGTPYKVLTLEAATLDFSLTSFLMASFAARLARFGATCALAFTVRQICPQPWRDHLRLVHAVFWIVFYLIYFAHMRA